MPDAFRIAQLVVDRAVSSHGDDIALVAYYGSQARGLASPTSDIDFFYTPVPGKTPPVNAHFVLDGLPYDFWPVSWSFLEEIAQARGERPWGVAAGILADAQVMVHRTQADLERFRSLQAQLADLLTPAQRPAMVGKALAEFTNTTFQLWQVQTATARGDRAGAYAAAWKLVNSVANSLALANQRYFTKGWGDNWPQVLALPLQPPGLDDLAQRILRGGDDALAAADALVRGLRELLLAAQTALAEPQPPKQVFADFYLVVVELRHKIEKACARGDSLAAGHAAFLLQNEIAFFMHQVTPGFAPADFHLLGETLDGYRAAGFPELTAAAAAGDLPRLAEQARRLDDAIAAWLTAHGVDLGVLGSETELPAFLRRRSTSV
jgi:hypothetical protein